jgi:hypothetical protein
MANRLENDGDRPNREPHTPVAPAQDAADSSRDPDMEDWRKAFGDQVPPAVKEFLEYRHREWELGIEDDLKARQEASDEDRRNLRDEDSLNKSASVDGDTF